MSARTDPGDFRDRDLRELHAHEADMEPVGLEEIAQRLGVKRDTADKWRTRKILPEPTWPSVGGRPAWQWGTIRRWAQETGRTTDALREAHENDGKEQDR